MSLPEKPPTQGETVPNALQESEFDYAKYGAKVEKLGRNRSGFIDAIPFQSGLSERAFRKFQQLVSEATRYVNHNIVTFETTEGADAHHDRREKRGQAARDLGVSETPLEKNRLRLSSGLAGSLMLAERLLRFLDEDPSTPISEALKARIGLLWEEIGPYNTFSPRFIGMREKDTEQEKIEWVERITDRFEGILDFAERPSQFL